MENNEKSQAAKRKLEAGKRVLKMTTGGHCRNGSSDMVGSGADYDVKDELLLGLKS